MSDPGDILAAHSMRDPSSTRVHAGSSSTLNTGGRLPAGAVSTLGLLVFSTFVVVLTETIMSVALASVITDLGVSVATAQWLTTGYLLTMAIIIPTTGYLLQRFTTRQAFITAMTLFSVGTLIGALSTTFAMLLVGRIVQAAGAAVMMPLLMTAVLHVVPTQRRGATLGTVVMMIAVAPALGPGFSGAVLSSLDWHYLFWSILPISLIGLGIGVAKLGNLSRTSAAPCDPISVVLSAIAFGALIYGLSSFGRVADDGVAIPPAIPLLVGLMTLSIFAMRQRRLARADRALLDLRTFRSPQFATAILGLALVSVILLGTLTVVPLYLQTVLGTSALTTGLMMLPGGLMMALLAPIAGRLHDRIGPGPLIIPGAVVLTGAQGWFASTSSADGSPWMTMGAFTVMHVALAFLVTPLMTAALQPLGEHLYSHGSATLSTVQHLAGAAGAATYIALVAVGTHARSGDGPQTTAAAAGGARDAFLLGTALAVAAVIAVTALNVLLQPRFHLAR